MTQNIVWYIGYNASGKTRKLIQLANDAIRNNKKIITNLGQYGLNTSTQKDSNKLKLLEESNNRLYYELLNNKINTNDEHIEYIRNLFNMICSKGDILIIDELDCNIRSYDSTFIARAISSVRSLWDSIYVTGRDENLAIIFTDFSDVYSAGVSNPNYHLINENGEDIEISERQAYEYFDTL